MPTRKPTAVWQGGLPERTGPVQGQTGLGGQYNFSSRFENGAGSNPEELLAAAHAACFSMALAAGLEKGGFPPTKVETEAACTVEKIGAGFKITRMQLTSRATVPNIDDAKFQAIASATKEGCPVSGALKGNVQLDLDAKLTP
jgi:osmotically inducible protein OsmC